MRTLPIAMLLVLALGPAARAGVYHLSDPNLLWKVYGGPPLDRPLDPNDPEVKRVEGLVDAAMQFNLGPKQVEGVPDRLALLRALALEPKGQLDPFSPRALLLRQIEYLEKLRESRPLDPVEAVGLSACYLRLAPPREAKLPDTHDYRKKARRVLEETDRNHFLVQAALATVFQQDGNYEWAEDHQRRALELWPKVWVGWTADQLAFYKTCEQYNQKILEFRRANPDQSAGAAVTLDPLFPFVPVAAKAKKGGLDFGASREKPLPPANQLRFVNEQGKYAAGELAEKEAAKIPSLGTRVVLQLAIWQPRDRRLTWLLAELLNANGAVEPAARMLTGMVESDKLEWPELRQHQLILEKAAAVMRLLNTGTNPYLPVRQGNLFGNQIMMLTPRAHLGPVVADVAHFYSAFAADEYVARYEPPPQAAPPETPKPPLPFNVSHVVISFIFGVLVAALLGMQWQALKRRRPAAEPAADESQETAPAETANVPKSEGVMQEAPPS